ncbi:MAG TPA: hydroxysqualene dehydroxylase HpnE [Candidatus Binataceae bacterium]|nr:hydroxysqualene dehydroxylase HpnE [Candidatus Binataceae bacterium]
MADDRDVVIIGGGFAGLSAGVALAERGFRVAVLERKPALGGRAYSFVDSESGDSVDNGQHVLMGCYVETLDFLKQIGTYDKLVFRENLEIEMVAPNGARAAIRTAPLPGPLHMAAAVLRYKHLSLRERVDLLQAGLRLLSMRRSDRATLEQTDVAAMMDRLHQSEHARESFWYPVTIATLNEEPTLASSALLAEVMKRAFFASRRDSAFVYSKVGLSDLYCTAAAKFIHQREGIVTLRTGVESLELNGDGMLERVRLRDGNGITAANVIAAVPCGPLLQMLPAAARENPFFTKLAGLGNSPIICVHVWLDREVVDSAFVGFIGTTTQWLFNKRKIFEARGEHHPGYLSFVISGARAQVERSNEELLDQVMTDLRTMIPAAREAKVVKALVLKEKQATMAPAPSSHALRPATSTPIPNLFLAGDWIQTGLPATIESAVVSGRAAAAAVIARVEQGRTQAKS